MDFELSEDLELMRAGLRELLERECGIRRVREHTYDGDFRDDAALWGALGEAGWLSVTAAEDVGGMDLSFEALMTVAMEAGRAVLPLPLTTTLLAVRTIQRAAQPEVARALVQDAAARNASITIALKGARGTHNDDSALGLRAVASAEGWRLDGRLRAVPFGPSADFVLVEADAAGEARLFLVPAGAPGLTWMALSPLDRTTPRHDLTADGVAVRAEAAASVAGDGGVAVAALEQEWCAVLAAESLGASERMVEIASDYAKVRVQFGRPIGTNQAVKVRIAEMATAVERMRVAVYLAALRIDEGSPDRALACSFAKGMASNLGAYVGTQAIHVHGGIGYTWEHDIHIYMKRTKSNELFLGDAPTHMSRIADLVLAT